MNKTLTEILSLTEGFYHLNRTLIPQSIAFCPIKNCPHSSTGVIFCNNKDRRRSNTSTGIILLVPEYSPPATVRIVPRGPRTFA